MIADERSWDDPTLLPLGNIAVRTARDHREATGIVTPDTITRAIEKPQSSQEIRREFMSLWDKIRERFTGKKKKVLANEADYRLSWPAAQALLETFSIPAAAPDKNGQPLFRAYALNWVEH